jgi:hypothetical protein
MDWQGHGRGSVEKVYFSSATHEIVIASIATSLDTSVQSPTSDIIANFGDCFVALRLLAKTLFNLLNFSTNPGLCPYR